MKKTNYKVQTGGWEPARRGRKSSELSVKILAIAEKLEQRQWFDVPVKDASTSLLRTWLKELSHISLSVIKDNEGNQVATRVYYKVK